MVKHKLVWIMAMILVVSIILVIGIYKWNFYNNISGNPENWGQFGDFFGGVLNPIISGLNLILIIYLTLKIADIDEKRSTNQQKESVRPLGIFHFNLSVGSLHIELHNVGVGPLIITEFFIEHNNSKVSDFQEIINSVTVPYRPQYTTTKKVNEGLIVRKDDYVVILKISVIDNFPDMEPERKLEGLNLIKSEIEKCKIFYSYTDLYGNFIKEELQDLKSLKIDLS